MYTHPHRLQPSTSNLRTRTPRTRAPAHPRGAQPANRNALKTGRYSARHPGPLREYWLLQKRLYNSLRPRSAVHGPIPNSHRPRSTVNRPDSTSASIHSALDFLMQQKSLEAHILSRKLIHTLSLNNRPARRLAAKKEILASLAHDPFSFIEEDYQEWGITRDTDSFLPVPEKSARNSRCAAVLSSPQGTRPRTALEHPCLPTNLTDEQWAVLSPLIPPDPPQDWLFGEPPVIIAANRFGFTRYLPTGEFNDFCIMERYQEVIQPFAASLYPSPRAFGKKRGRPRSVPSPRPMLDAIFWKLATGRTWAELPFGFPPVRLCRAYYRRLFKSGRLYTLLLALHNHMRLEAIVDPYLLWEKGIFTTTPSQHITLMPGVKPTWQNCTALLFMQLARNAWLRSRRLEAKQERAGCPPLLDGDAPLAISPSSCPPDPHLAPLFVPLERCAAAQKWEQHTCFERTLQKRIHSQPHRPLKPSGVSDVRRSTFDVPTCKTCKTYQTYQTCKTYKTCARCLKLLYNEPVPILRRSK